MNKEQAYKKLASFQFIRIFELPSLKNLIRGVIFLTGCSKLKSDLAKGISKEIYVSKKNQSLYSFCEKNNLKYGTLSDKYGLVKANQIIQNYELAPENITREQKEYLKIQIEKQLAEEKIDTIYFFGPRLLQSFTYLYLLKDYPAKKFLITTLKKKIRKRALI